MIKNHKLYYLCPQLWLAEAKFICPLLWVVDKKAIFMDDKDTYVLKIALNVQNLRK